MGRAAPVAVHLVCINRRPGFPLLLSASASPWASRQVRCVSCPAFSSGRVDETWAKRGGRVRARGAEGSGAWDLASLPLQRISLAFLTPHPRLLWRCTLQLFKPLTCCSRRLSHPHLEAPGAGCSLLGLACCSVLSGKDVQGGGSEWGDGESLTRPLILERAPELDLLSKREQRPNKNTYR